jgi:dTDP-4-dehydrorhamnose reductase
MGEDIDLRGVINCAAMSSPGQCEAAPELAQRANAPRALWQSILSIAQSCAKQEPLWIQLSTDHVYDGKRALSDEHTPCAPVNAYGASKVFCEERLAEEYPRSIVLRSSIITGPKAPLKDVQRTLFLDFIASSFSKETPTTFYADEFRSPICVFDIVSIVRALLERHNDLPKYRVYNMGGPDRVSRVDMAHGVAKFLAKGDTLTEKEYKSKITVASCAEAKALRGVAAPPDISMDSSAIIRDVCRDWAPRSFEEQIAVAFST